MQFKDIFNYEEIIHTSVKKKGFRSISQYYGGYSQPVFCQYDKPFSKKKKEKKDFCNRKSKNKN